MKKICFIAVVLLWFTVSFATELVIEFQKVPETSYVFIKDKMFFHAVTLAETIDAEYKWNNSEKSLSVWWNDHYIKFIKDDESVLLDDEWIEMSEPALLIENRFFLPLLDCCKLFGLRVVVHEEMVQIFTSTTSFCYNYMIDDGVGLKFDKRVSYVIRKQTEEMIELELYGATLEEDDFEITPDIEGLNQISVKTSSAGSLAEYVSISVYFDKNTLLIPVLENQNTIWLKPNVSTVVRDSKKVVVIDPGHGGIDIGCVGKNKTYEKDVVLNIANELKRLLENNNYIVYMTRSNDTYIELKERAIYANTLDADLFISIHMNSASTNGEYAEGLEIYYYQWLEWNYKIRLSRIYSADKLTDSFVEDKIENKIEMVAESKILAQKIVPFVKENNIVFRKIAQKRFDVIANTEMPSVLVECNFLSNPEIEEAFASYQTVSKYANVLFSGIDSYFWGE